MKIGILTFHRAYNCGAMLQAWALQTVLERMGHQVSFPACNDVGYCPPKLYCTHIPESKKGLQWLRSLIGRLYLDLRGKREGDKRGKYFDRFRKLYLREQNCGVDDFKDLYDLMVIGSDQVFSVKHIDKWSGLFYGEDIPQSLPKIAYAGSIGDTPKSGDDLVRFKRALASFGAVSFREPFEGHAVVSDPTILLTAPDYDELCKKRLVKEKGDYIYMYSITTSDFQVDSARQIAKQLGLRLIISPAYPSERSMSYSESRFVLSPERMVQYIRGAKYVIAGSFHGSVLSLLHNKPFICIRDKVDEPESRPAALLKRIGLIDRRVDPSVPVSEMVKRLTATLPQTSLDKLASFRAESLAWLKNSISHVGN